MATQWRQCLAIVGLAFVFGTIGCGEEDPEEDPNQQTEFECEEHDDCSEDDGEPYCTEDFASLDEPQCVECMTDDNCDGDAPYCVQGECNAINACDNADDDCFGDTPFCDDDGNCTDQDPAQCQTDDDCTESGAPYCNDGSCVPEEFICQLQDCGGQRGVCDPSEGADGDCVDADSCDALSQCTEDSKCVDNECVPRDEVCDCEGEEVCEHDSETLSVSCELDQICEPGSRECDDDFLVVCSDDGTTEQTPFCTEGCIEEDDDAFCQSPEGETCNAPLMPDGDELTTWEIPWQEYANNYNLDDASCVNDEDLDDSDVASRTGGTDAVFGAELAPGEVGVFELYTELDYAVAYMLDGCSSDASSVCVEADGHIYEQDDDGDYMRALWYENDTDETKTVYFVGDTGSGAAGAGLSATANVVASEQVCEPGEDVCSGGELGECSTYGTHFETDSSRSCTNECYDEDDPSIALCEPADHSSCDDAIEFDADTSEVFSGNILDFHADDVLNSADCIDQSVSGEEEFAGPTAYYTVELEDNQRLNANLASDFDAGIWFSTGCGTGGCQKAVNDDDVAEHAEYVADGNETIIVVVQAVEEQLDSGEFTLSMNTDAPLCEGQDSGDILGCVDDDFIHYCYGSDYPDRYECDGPCDDGACVEPTGNQCLDAIPIGDGDSKTVSFATGSDDLTPLSCAGDTENFNDPVGPDYVFELDVETNDLVQIDFDTISPDAGIYLLEDCPVASQNVTDRCIEGSIPFDGEPVEFFAEEDATYYIVADSGDRFDPADVTVDVDITQTNCRPDSQRCEDGVVEVCGDDGEDYELIASCAIGCADEASVCGAPDEANNRCDDATTQTVDSPGQIVDDFERFDQQENIGEGEGGCFEDGTEGPDVFYEVELDPEDALRLNATVDIDDIGFHDVGLYITDGCVTDGADCSESVLFTGSDVMEESIEYYSESGGTYTVGLVGVDDFDSGEFILDFEFFEGECSPGQDDSCDGDTATQCTSLGQLIETDCPDGCEDGVCLDKKGDLCSRTHDMDDDGSDDGDTISFSVSDEIGGYSDELNPYEDGQSCTGYYGDGPDVIVSLEAWAGDELQVDFDTEYDGAIWLTSECGSGAAAQCVEGVDEAFGPDLEQLSYTFDQQGTYYIVGDAVQSGATGDFDLDATLEKGPRDDDPQLQVTGTDDLSWEVDINESATDQFEVSNDGDLELVVDIAEDIDWLDVSPESTTVDGGETTDFDLTVTCGSDAETLNDSFDIESNDPATDDMTVDVELHCNDPAPVAEVTGAEDLSWDVEVDESAEDSFQIGNLGDNDLTFDIIESIDWLDATPESGTVAGGETEHVDLTVTCGSDEETLSDSFDVETNEPGNGVETLDVELTCVDTSPTLELTGTDELSWEVEVDESADDSFQIGNVGQSDLTYEIAETIDWFEATPESGTVASGDTEDVDLTVTCGSDEETLSDSFDVETNEPANGVETVDVELTCVDTSPTLELMGTDELSWDVDVNESADDSFQVGNVGESDLTFDIVENIDWLDATPESGTLAEGDTEDIDLTVTCGSDEETLSDSFDIDTNDPNASMTSVDVELHCNDPAPALELTGADDLSWDVEIDETATDSFQIGNLGDDDLTFDIMEDIDWFEATPESGTVSGGDAEDVDVTVTCGSDEETLSDSFDVETNEPGNGVETVAVELNCQDTSPTLELTGTDDLSWDVEVDESADDSFQVGNVGESDLSYDIVESIDWLETTPESGTVASGDSEDVDVTVTCGSDEETLSDSFDVETNEPGNGVETVAVELNCQDTSPTLELTGTDDLSWDVEVDESADDSFQVGNVGESDLTYDIVESIDWLDATPESGTVESGETDDVDLTVTCGSEEETLTDSFDVETNDPNNAETTVDVELNCVDPSPTAELTGTDELSWDVEVDESADDSFQIGNLGDNDLTYDIVESIDWLDATPESGTVESGETDDVDLTVTCGSEEETLSDSFDVETNDPDNASTTVSVELTCVDEE